MEQYGFLIRILKQARVHFQRNRTIVPGLDVQLASWSSGYAAVSYWGYKYILTVIDILLTKHTWALAVKNKSGKEVSEAFKYIFSHSRKHAKLQTDRGKEFLSTIVSSLLK